VTTALREAVSPQGDYYADARDIFAQLDRLERDSLIRILSRVNELRREVTDSLLAMPVGQDDTWQAWQLKAYQAELEQAVARWGARVRAELAQDLQSAADLGKRQMPALTTLAQAEGVPASMVSFGSLGLLDDQIAVSVMHSADLIKSVEASVVTSVNRQIQGVVFGGQSRGEAVAAIRAALATQAARTAPGHRFGSLTSQALRVEQTELIRVYNLANEYGIRNAQEELPGIMKEWVTVLDGKADPDCRALSGKRVKPGATFPGGVTAPPLHPRCRCRVVSWLPYWPADPFPLGTPHRPLGGLS
jgi:SPP1 gp7 family putative phage head morphogenesis protein